ncbi:MAG: DUF4136 domain-containing protein [Bacteroidota bacterium]
MKKLIAIFTSILFLTSCSSLDVNYDFDQKVNFQEFSTFSFYPWDYKHGYQMNEYDRQTILIAIQDQLEKKGYVYQKEGGEMVVSIFVTLKGKTSYDAYTNHYGGWAGYGGGWGYSGFGYGYGYGPGYSSSTVTVNHYTEGSLVIDFFSVASRKLIWQALGSRQVEPNLEKRDKKLPKNVAQMLMHFPAHKKKK